MRRNTMHSAARCSPAQSARGRRVGLSLLAVMLFLPLTGCVYWRLNQFRRQLSAFPDFFHIKEGTQPTVVARQPVLRPDDLGWLSGLAASEFQEANGRAREIYQYIKQPPDPGTPGEPAPFDIVIDLVFNAQQRLEEVELPLRFAPVITSENFEEVFRPMKDGRLAHADHATDWFWEEHRVQIPVRGDIEHFLGPPRTSEQVDGAWVYHYGYLLAGNTQRWNPTEWDLAIQFQFGPEEEEEKVVYAEVFMGRIQVQVDLRGKQNRVQIKRL